ncbi:MAG: efflux RND transporter periplasmic adaptor subunit [Chitinophagales bacterium]
MHPQVIRDSPGKCPICGMQLVKKSGGSKKMDSIDLGDLLKPTDEFVISSVPVTTIKSEKQEIELDVLGSITYDLSATGNISARVSGRIEKLYVRFRFQEVHAGQKIMDIYSPELMTAQQDLLFLLKNDTANSNLINSAKQKLIFMGMDEVQIKQIKQSGKPSSLISIYSNYSGHIHEASRELKNSMNGSAAMTESKITIEELSVKEGMYLQKGQTVFTVYNPGRLWATLNFYADQQDLVKAGDVVEITPETNPSSSFRARIDFIEPFFKEQNKTMTARAYFDNSKLNLPVGSQVKGKIITNIEDYKWLPAESIVSLGSGKLVFLKEDGGFRPRLVITGHTVKNKTQVLKGISGKDTVASNAQFLMDSESFIKNK